MSPRVVALLLQGAFFVGFLTHVVRKHALLLDPRQWLSLRLEWTFFTLDVYDSPWPRAGRSYRTECGQWYVLPQVWLRVGGFTAHFGWRGVERACDPRPDPPKYRDQVESTWWSRMSSAIVPAQILLLTVTLRIDGDWLMYADECPFTKRRKWRTPKWTRFPERDYANPSALWRYGPLMVDVIWRRTGVEERS
jgi:hypothetical protein